MALYFPVREQWSRKPPETWVVDRSHPLVADMFFLSIMNRRGAQFDLINGITGTVVDAPNVTTRVPTKHGLVADINQGSQPAGFDFGDSAEYKPTSLTIMTRALPRSPIDSGGSYLFAKRDTGGGSADYAIYLFTSGTAGNQWRYRINGSDDTIIRDTGSFFNELCDVALAVDSTGQDNYVWGVESGYYEDLTGQTGATVDTGTGHLTVCHRWEENRVFDGQPHFCVGWRGRKTKAFIELFRENPWQVLEPRRSWFLLSGAAGRSVDANTASLLLAEQAATVNRQRGVDANTGALLISEQASSINRQRGVSAGVAALTITPANTVLNRDRGVDATVASLLISAKNSTTTKGRNIAAGVAALTISPVGTSVLRNRGVAAGVAALILTEINSTVSRGQNLYPIAEFDSTRVFNTLTRHVYAVPSSNAGDLLLVGAATTDATGSLSINPGVWNEMEEQNATNNASKAKVWYKQASAAEGLQVSLSSFNDVSLHCAFTCRIQNWDGRAPNINPRSSESPSQFAFEDTFSAADVTPPWNSESLVIPFALVADDATSTTYSVQALLDDGYTQQVNARYAAAPGGGSAQVVVLSKETSPWLTGLPKLFLDDVDSARVFYRFVTVNGPNLGIFPSGAAALVLSPLASTLLRNRGVDANTPGLTVTPISDRQNVNRAFHLAAGVESLTISTANPSVNRARGVSATAAALNISEYATSINRTRGVDAATAALNITPYNPNVTIGRFVSAGTVGMAITAAATSINRARGVSAAAASLTISDYKVTTANRPRNVTQGAVVGISIATYSATITLKVSNWIAVADATGSWSAIGDATVGWSAIADANATWERTA